MIFTRILPWGPHILFAILEPIMAMMGAYTVAASPLTTITTQLPPIYRTGTEGNSLSPAVYVTLYQLANVYFLVGLCFVVVLWTSNPTTARCFLAVAGLGDVGHIYALYAGMGSVAFWDVGSWNDVVWLNVGISAFLLLNRVLTLLGVWGSLEGEERMKGD